MYLEAEGMCLLIFFESSSSCFEHQKHDSKLQFRKKYTLNSKYLIFGYKAFIGISMEKDNKVCRSQY